MGMSNNTHTRPESEEAPLSDGDASVSAEDFGEEALDVIRSLVEQDDVMPGNMSAVVPSAKSTTSLQKQTRWQQPRSGKQEAIEPEVADIGETSTSKTRASDWHDWANAPSSRSWRKIEVVEGGPSRALRRFLTTPRLFSILFLSGVVYWKPLFIPTLALVVVSIPLLVGALIGQDRVGRFMLRRIQRYIWNNPDLARGLEKITPRRSRHLLHRPASEQSVWDGPIDPSFADRLSRIRY